MHLFSSLAICIKDNLPKTIEAATLVIDTDQYATIVRNPADPLYKMLSSYRAKNGVIVSLLCHTQSQAPLQLRIFICRHLSCM